MENQSINNSSDEKQMLKLIDDIQYQIAQLKSWDSKQDYKWYKAKSEGLLSQAAIFYSDNPKVQALIAEFREEIAYEEKTFASKYSKMLLISAFKNKWTYFAIELIVLAAFVSQTHDKKAILFSGIIALISLVVVVIYKKD